MLLRSDSQYKSMEQTCSMTLVWQAKKTFPNGNRRTKWTESMRLKMMIQLLIPKLRKLKKGQANLVMGQSLFKGGHPTELKMIVGMAVG